MRTFDASPYVETDQWRGTGLRGAGDWADIRFSQMSPDLMRRFAHLVEGAPEIIEAHRLAGRSDYVVRFCGSDMSAWDTFREGVEALGCDAEARFSLLVEAVK